MFEMVSPVMSSMIMVRFASAFEVKIRCGDRMVMSRCCYVPSWSLVVNMLLVIRDVRSGSS